MGYTKAFNALFDACLAYSAEGQFSTRVNYVCTTLEMVHPEIYRLMNCRGASFIERQRQTVLDRFVEIPYKDWLKLKAHWHATLHDDSWVWGWIIELETLWAFSHDD